MDDRRRVVVSGLGCVSSLGSSVPAITAALLAGATGASRVPFEMPGLRSRLGCFVRDFDAARYLAPLKLRRIDTIGRFAVAATTDALADAGVPSEGSGREHIGVVLGTHTGGVESTGEYLQRYKESPTNSPPMLFASTVGNAAASLAALELGLRGPNATLTQKEASSLSAVVMATELVRRGRADALATGGADELYRHFYRIHDWFGVLATAVDDVEAARPFDESRNGMVLGEGASVLVIENEDTCLARGGRVYAEIAGVGSASGPAGINQWPDDPEPLSRVIRSCLADAGVSAGEVDAVYASANGSRVLDRTEARALRLVFGPTLPVVTSLKGAFGECGLGGATSIIGAIAAGASGLVAPTAGFRRTASDCGIEAPTEPVRLRGPHVLVASVASGGAHHAVLLRLRELVE
ncbi:MAG: beta-ketoacyl synthase N-terminal-like domain-containing protein [Vicinamibacterales bacterium]